MSDYDLRVKGILIILPRKPLLSLLLVSFEMVEKPRRGEGLNWIVKNLGYLCKLKATFN